MNLSVKVNRVKALEIIKRNRENHEKTYSEAMKKFKSSYIERLHEMSMDAKFPMFVNVRVPERHLEDYDSAIRMIEMSEEDTLLLESEVFDCLINDKWMWKQSFLENTQAYLAK